MNKKGQTEDSNLFDKNPTSIITRIIITLPRDSSNKNAPRTMSSGTPKFLKRMQRQKSPDASNFKHNRGASMTQSKSPGGIHFLSRQYQNVVQQAGTPTQAPPPQAPPLQVPPPPQASTSPTPRPVPALIPMPSCTLKKDPHFIQQHRRALDKRRQDNVHRDQQGIPLPNDVNRNHEQWCNDYDRLLLETDKVLAMYTHMQAMYTQMQKVQEVNDAQTKDTAAKTSNDKVVVQQLRQNVQQLRQKDTAQTSEIAALKGTVAQLEATVTSTKTLLTDEQERCEVMRIERNQARKTELMALDNAVTKAECEKLANRVAVLESDNAVLLAEKSQWLNNLERENTHLTELFDEARSAKDVMVRELNAIDEERIQLANEREELQQLLNENEVINSTKIKVPGASAHAGFFRVTHTTFDTMSEARLKFYKLQEKLKRRQDKITTVFDAGSTLIHYYSNSNEGPAAANAVMQLTGSLLERALHCDMSLVEDALSKSLDISNGSSYVDNNEDVRSIWEELDTRLEEQTSVMERGKCCSFVFYVVVVVGVSLGVVGVSLSVVGCRWCMFSVLLL
jgi:hypothetical protein